MPHTFTHLLTHVVFSTKERVPALNNELRPKLHAYMGGIIRELHGTALIVNGMADHVHLLISLPPALSISDTLRVLKANSSRWTHEMKGMPFSWQAGYGAFSVSQSNVQAVTAYIAHQEEHHRQLSFQEEFVTLLKKHGIEFDERYLWS